MPIPQLQDLPRSPINLSDEYLRYQDLVLKLTPLTTSGIATWTSASSNITYTATTGGEAQLLDLLQTALDNYLLNASKWNAIPSQINDNIIPLKRKLRMGVRV